MSILKAISDGDLWRIREIVGVDPSALSVTGEFGQSPLMHAIGDADRQFDIVEFLVTSGADVNFATAEGYTALHANIDVNGPSGSGDMPYRIARLLQEHGADLEHRNHYGWTPLMRAALEGTGDEFNALLQVGARFDVVYPEHAMPVFTRTRPLAWVVLPWPRKLEMLVAAGFAPQRSLLDQAKAALAEAQDQNSVFGRGVQDSIRVIERALARRSGGR